MKLLYTDLKINNCEVISDGVRKLKRHVVLYYAYIIRVSA